MKSYGIKDILGNKSEVELKKVSIQGNVCGEYVEFTITQVYKNNAKNNIEAVYTFPIPDTAVMTLFEANIGGRTIRSVIEEKEKVESIYEKAIERGETTLILERINSKAFSMSIGKIIPNEEVIIKVSYIDDLKYKNGSLYLNFPAINMPKNVNLIQHKNPLVDKIAEKILREEESDYEFDLNIIVESLCKMEFKSLTHKIKVERDGDYLSKINLLEDNCLSEDFVLIMDELEHLEADGMIYEYKDDKKQTGIIYLRLIPKIEINNALKPEHYTFLIDVSETMKGIKIEEAKNALQMCIRNLEEGDTFNIISAGKNIEYFSPNIQVEFNEENLSKATVWIQNLTADGDPDIFDAIKKCLANIGSEKDNTILFFTDDFVENDDEILEYVKNNLGENRIFTFGIDTSANSYFLNKLAQIGYGKAEFIYKGQSIEDIVLRQFNRIENPQVDDIKIDWGKMEIDESYPRTIKYMYDREPFAIFARYHGELEKEITISGKVNNEDFIRKINLDNFELEENANLLQKVWCRKRIKSIEDRMRTEKSEIKEAMKKEVIEISKKYEIISPETSFIIVEEREEPVLGIQLRNIIPIKTILKSYAKENYENTENPSFIYKPYNIRNDNKNDNEYLNKLYPRERIFKILAKNQFADGSFVDFADNLFEDRVETTATVLLAFAIGNEDINIYAKQLKKSIDYLVKTLEVNGDYLSERLYYIISLAFKASLQRDILKDKDEMLQKLYWIEEVVNKKQFNNGNEISEIINENLGKKHLKTIFKLSKDGKIIEEYLNINNEESSIFDFGKLAILEAF